MKIAICLVSLAVVVLAEPPVPSNQYLPSNFGGPSQSYGAPGFGGQTDAIFRGSGRPSSGYGAPQRPSSNYGAPSSQYGAPGGGYDDGPSEPANYHFEYKVQDAESGNDFGHEESRQGDVAQGKYYVLLPDGRRQVVEYIADNEGYKPKISYEGTANAGGYPSGPSGGGYSGGGYSGGGYSGGGYSGGQGGYQGQGGQGGYNY